jgi:hypothetical protein
MKRSLPVIFLIVLAIIALVIKQFNHSNNTSTVNRNSYERTNKVQRNGSTRGLNRNPSYISYSKHARCRMGCRHIDESEVKEILHEGTINYNKSELQGDDCHKRYAVEGITHDEQKVRIIFAPCNDEVTVVTVIDLGEEWPCDCK